MRLLFPTDCLNQDVYVMLNGQICGRRRRRREETESLASPPVASGNAVISAGPIITRSGMNVNLNPRKEVFIFWTNTVLFLECLTRNNQD